MNISDSIFQGDVKDRYADDKTSRAVTAVPGDDFSSKLEKAAAEPGDIVNMMVTAKDRVDTAKAVFRTDPAAGTAMLRQLEDERSANMQGILAYRKIMPGYVKQGEITDAVMRGADYLANASFLDEDLTMPSGQSVKLREYLSAPESRSSLEGQASSTLRRAGFDDKVSSMMYGFVSPSGDALNRIGNDEQSVRNYSRNYNGQARQTMEFFTAPTLDLDRAGQNSVLNGQADVAARIDMANEVASNYDEYFQMFGVHTAEAMKEAYNGLKGEGGAPLLMSVCRYAAVYGREHNLSGAAAMRKVISQIKDYKNAVSRSDSQQPVGKGRDPGSFSVYEQSAAMITAMGELADSDARFDFDNPSMRAEAVKLGDTLAKLKANGVDFTALCRGNGMDPGREMAAALIRGTTGQSTPGNMLDKVNDWLADRSRFTGGKDFADQVYEATGDARDYYSSIDRKNGGQSSNKAVDALLSEFNKIRDQFVLPKMFKRGMSHKDVFASTRMNYKDSTEYLTRVSSLLENRFKGPGAAEAADIVAGYLYNHESDLGGGRVNFQDLFERIATDPKVRKESPNAAASLSDWLDANVGNARLFAPYARKMFQKLRADGVSPELAYSRVSEASDSATKLMRSGKQWEGAFNAYINSEIIPKIVPGDPQRGEPPDATFTRINADRLDGEFKRRDGTTIRITPGMYSDPRTSTLVKNFLDELRLDAADIRDAHKRFLLGEAAIAAKEGR